MKSTIKYLAPWLAALGLAGRSPLLPRHAAEDPCTPNGTDP